MKASFRRVVLSAGVATLLLAAAAGAFAMWRNRGASTDQVAVHVRVWDVAGKPVSGAHVRVRGVEDEIVGSGMTDRRGRFSIEYAPNAAWVAAERGADRGRASMRLETVHVRIGPPGEVLAEVTGPAGEAITGATVTAECGPPPIDRRSGTTDAGGIARVSIPSGICEITFAKPGFLLERKAGVQVLDGTTTRVSQRLAAGARLSGRLVDAGGKPVAGTVSAFPCPGLHYPTEIGTAIAGSDGRFSLDHLPVYSLYALGLSANGHRPTERHRIAAGAAGDVTITAGAGLVLDIHTDTPGEKGNVHLAGLGGDISRAAADPREPSDRTGSFFENWWTIWARQTPAAGNSRVSGTNIERFTTDAHGDATVELRGLPPGDFELLVASGSSIAVVERLVLAEGVVERRRIDLTTGSPFEGRLTIGGKPPEKGALNLVEYAEPPLAELDADGRFRFAHVTAGTYRLRGWYDAEGGDYGHLDQVAQVAGATIDIAVAPTPAGGPSTEYHPAPRWLPESVLAWVPGRWDEAHEQPWTSTVSAFELDCYDDSRPPVIVEVDPSTGLLRGDRLVEVDHQPVIGCETIYTDSMLWGDGPVDVVVEREATGGTRVSARLSRDEDFVVPAE